MTVGSSRIIRKLVQYRLIKVSSNLAGDNEEL